MLQTHEKEELIRHEIINANYSIQDFYEFLRSSKASGEQITNWSLEELRGKVRAFTENCQGINGKSEDEHGVVNRSRSSTDSQMKERSNQMFHVINEDDHIATDIYEIDSDNKILLSEFFKTDQILIKVTTVTTETSFWFLKSSLYTIITEPFGWSVNRYFEDFIELRRSLKKTYPLTLVG
jgi:hypothetical protein